MVSDSHSTSATDFFEALRAAVVDGPGTTATSVRRTALDGGCVSGDSTGYVDKVRRHAYKVIDTDIDALHAAGWSDDGIFELTVATALGAALSRRARARRAMDA